jgi:hypothetical protein
MRNGLTCKKNGVLKQCPRNILQGGHWQLDKEPIGEDSSNATINRAARTWEATKG